MVDARLPGSEDKLGGRGYKRSPVESAACDDSFNRGESIGNFCGETGEIGMVEGGCGQGEDKMEGAGEVDSKLVKTGAGVESRVDHLGPTFEIRPDVGDVAGERAANVSRPVGERR
jgi:hypothetical protein